MIKGKEQIHRKIAKEIKTICIRREYAQRGKIHKDTSIYKVTHYKNIDLKRGIKNH